MRDTVRELLATLHDSRDAAYCRLVETRGSTPQKAGAMMLVYADGSQAGTLGGGCVEAEVKRRALAALASRQAEAPVFQLDSDYGWDDGLICGGRMQVLIQPIDAHAATYFQALAQQLDEGRGATEVVVFDEQAAGFPAPSSFLLDQQGRLVARLAPEDPPEWILDQVPPLQQRPRASVQRGVAYLPSLTRCRLLIVGAGHVGLAVARLADEVDFDVWVADDRADIASPERFPMARRLLTGSLEETLPAVPVDADTYCLIVTRGHQHDERALYHLCQRGARYVGLIGSRRKIRMIFEDLLNEGVPAESLSRVFAPLGIDIGSRTVAEIAVSICAELIAHRNLGRVPGRPAAIDPLAPHGPARGSEAEV